ncbi:hypothetical protein QS306_05645 [Paraburkholderia bonniea]|uniref:hypothetical protein n=1 Tax=Paraburkholderia bonniea TaxID=2152891 RepID=UPI001290C401|nr:hypothetical protein [Paraburkholderia bonniea]WJF91124.1 hypothetical protein QS306_05645 [Paraburkholderia bonniea]WJF94439.1 hypothetical protein QS308_05650 [Paraburkholderia bonniea]
MVSVICSLRLARAGFGAVLLSTLLATGAVAASGTSARPPVVLDSQQGIHDGQNGLMLQTAPLVRAPIAAPQPMAAPAELAPNDRGPIIVAPYIGVPGGMPMPPYPGPHPHPQPYPGPMPR